MLLVAGLFVSCAQHEITSTWKNEALPEMVLEDVLVIGQAKHPTTRRIFENAFVEDLVAEGVEAKVSFTHNVQGNIMTRETLLKVIGETEAKTVLITRLVDRRHKTMYQDSVNRTTSIYEEPYGAYFDSPAPQAASTKIYVYLESKIYDVKSEQLLWSASARCKDPVMTKKYMGEITDLLVMDLKLKKLL